MSTPRFRCFAFLLAVFGPLALAEAPAQAAKSSERLGATVVPVRQDVELRLDPDRARYEGRVRIELDVREESPSFTLHSEGLELLAVTLGAGETGRPAAWEAVSDDLVRILPPAPLSPGRALLTIDFRADFDTTAVGLYRVETGGEAYAYTQFEADDAREAFPCFDEPGFKIPWKLTLSTPAGDTAIANTPVESEREADGWRTTVFAESPPLPSYLVALAVGPFDLVEIPGASVPTRIVAPAGRGRLAGYAVGNTVPILAALEEWFGRPYPFRKLDLIAVPEFWPGAMENPGAITYRDTILLLDPEALTVAQRRTFARVTAHELAHQWFGNLVTMQWWDDLWLNETFADWLGDRITDRVYPDLGLLESELAGAQRVFAQDARSTARAIRREFVPGERLMDGIGVAYNKGKLVLAMFEGWIGEEAFRRGVVDYVDANAWGNAEGADLWEALDRASGRPVSDALRGFLQQPGYPILRAGPGEDGRWRVDQRRFVPRGADLPGLAWQVPVAVAWSEGGVGRRETFLVGPEGLELPIEGTPDWIRPNAGGVGYYRWEIPPDLLGALVTDPPAGTTARDRIELVGNLRALLDAGALDGGTWVRALAGLAADPDPQVLATVLAQVSQLPDTFGGPDTDAALAAWARRVLGPARDRLGWEVTQDEDPRISLVRPTLLELLGGWAEDPEVIARGAELGRAFLHDPSAVDPSLASTALALASREGDAALFDDLRARFEAATVPAERSRWLSALGAFRAPALRERAFAYVLATKLAPQDVGVIPRAMITADEGARDLVLDWTLEHYEELSRRIPPPNRVGFVRLAGGCSIERFERAQAFFSVPERGIPGLSSALARTEASVRQCVALREAEIDAVRAAIAPERP
jgi:alanyl aminopeptidase